MEKKELRIVFMGTPDFAVASLKALVDGGYNIVGVITAPDKPAGRGKKLNQSAVKKYAVENNLNVLQPEKLKNPDFSLRGSVSPGSIMVLIFIDPLVLLL